MHTAHASTNHEVLCTRVCCPFEAVGTLQAVHTTHDHKKKNREKKGSPAVSNVLFPLNVQVHGTADAATHEHRPPLNSRAFVLHINRAFCPLQYSAGITPTNMNAIKTSNYQQLSALVDTLGQVNTYKQLSRFWAPSSKYWNPHVC